MSPEFGKAGSSLLGTVVTTKHRPVARRAPARRTGSRGAHQATRRRTAAPEPSLFRRHAADLWAIGLITLGVLLALALWGQALGPVGHAVDTGLATLVGWTRIIIPLVSAGAGVVLLIERERPEPLRTGLGAILGIVGFCGLGELAKGTPSLSDSQPLLATLRQAGGWVGALVGHPLRAGIGSAGAAVLLVVLIFVAGLIATGVSLATFGRGVSTVGGAVGATLASWWNAGVTDEDEEEEEEEYEEEEYEEPVVKAKRGKAADPPADDELEEEEEEYEYEYEDEEEELDPDLEEPEVEPERVPAVVGAVPRPGASWELPKIKLLSATKQLSHDMRQLDAAGQTLVAALEAHGVTTTLLDKTVGPTVTRFELELGPGVKVARVTSLSRDIAGRAVMANLAEMPHILISGATGAGKSSCINSIITSVLMRSTPEQVRLMLIDPKRVELGQYNGLQHLISPVVVDPKKAANALQWAVKEMERRYDLLAENGMRDITGYNLALAAGEITPVGPPSTKRRIAESTANALGADHSTVYTDDEIDDEPPLPEVLPFILIVVDELNDLMMVAARDVEDSVVRIAQMARAVGIHLVLATQRPSVDVITGVIKANIPSRMALSVSSLADSRVILDQAGAERLVGKGDMLLLTASSNVPRRLQAPWVSEKEVKDVVHHWQAQGGMTEPVVGIENILESLPGGVEGVDDDDDEYLWQAMDLVVRSQLGSTSMLQRKLRVGFARAGRLMDLLERRGVVGPSEGSKARQVLMTTDELDALTHR